MEHCRSPDGVTRVSVRLYYTMLSRVYLSVSFLVYHNLTTCTVRTPIFIFTVGLLGKFLRVAYTLHILCFKKVHPSGIFRIGYLWRVALALTLTLTPTDRLANCYMIITAVLN